MHSSFNDQSSKPGGAATEVDMMPIYMDFLGKMINNLDDLKAAKTIRNTDQLRQTLGNLNNKPSAMHSGNVKKMIPMKNKLGLASSRASLMDKMDKLETKPTSS